MRRKIEIDLPPNSGKYEVIEFTSREKEKYDIRQAVEGLAELFDCLYDQIPNEVMERLRLDPRTMNLRKRL